jgi:hypothetical protein
VNLQRPCFITKHAEECATYNSVLTGFEFVFAIVDWKPTLHIFRSIFSEVNKITKMVLREKKCAEVFEFQQ